MLFIDSPVSGGPKGARDGALSCMLGGNAAASSGPCRFSRRSGRSTFIWRGGRRPIGQSLQSARHRHDLDWHLRSRGPTPKNGRRSLRHARCAAGRLHPELRSAKSLQAPARRFARAGLVVLLASEGFKDDARSLTRVGRLYARNGPRRAAPHGPLQIQSAKILTAPRLVFSSRIWSGIPQSPQSDDAAE